VQQVELGGQLVADAVGQPDATLVSAKMDSPGGDQAVGPRLEVVGVLRAVVQVRREQPQCSAPSPSANGMCRVDRMPSTAWSTARIPDAAQSQSGVPRVTIRVQHDLARHETGGR